MYSQVRCPSAESVGEGHGKVTGLALVLNAFVILFLLPFFFSLFVTSCRVWLGVVRRHPPEIVLCLQDVVSSPFCRG